MARASGDPEALAERAPDDLVHRDGRPCHRCPGSDRRRAAARRQQRCPSVGRSGSGWRPTAKASCCASSALTAPASSCTEPQSGSWQRGWLRRSGSDWSRCATGLAALLDGDPDGAIEHAIQFLRPGERDHNLFLSGAGQLNSAHRWKGSLEVVRDAMADFAERENGLPLTRSLGAVALAISGDIDRARSLLDPVLRSATPLADDSTLERAVRGVDRGVPR